MIYSDNRDDIRQTYFTVWQKVLDKQVLTPLEQQIAQVILDHPEYHNLFNQSVSKYQEYLPELGQTNPFLHMGLHLGLREQVTTDRPHGIAKIHQTLSKKLGSNLEAEHTMMEHLVEAMWQAQRNNSMPDEQQYLESLKKL